MSIMRFIQDRRGSIAPMFGFLVVPLIGLAGAAVDYSRANSTRTAMQASLDATALALSKDVTTLTAAQATQKAQDYFNANFSRPGTSTVVVTATYTSNPSTLTVSATGSISTTFMKVMGISSMALNSTSTVTWGMTRLRVALVLDNTGSMSSANKMTALKTAAKNLIAQLQAAASTNGDVYVSIIPFAKDVNVDPVNYSQTWVKFADPNVTDDWDDNNGSCSKGNASTKSSCTSQYSCSISGNYSQSTCTSDGVCSNTNYNSSQNTCTSHGTCSKSSYTTQSNCTSNHGTWTPYTWTAGVWSAATWTADNHNTWTGCVMDRDQNYDTTNTAPSVGTIATLFPAEQYDACPVPMMGLSYNWSALNSKIDAMQPNGGTNQAIGLQWGFQSLTSAPFTIPAMDPNYTYSQVIILLSDGLNTQDRWPAYGNGVTQYNGSIDARQQILCNNVKAAGITIYTVQVNTDGDPTSTLLQNCASDSSKFFLLTSSTGIVTTFNQIGTALSALRITR